MARRSSVSSRCHVLLVRELRGPRLGEELAAERVDIDRPHCASCCLSPRRDRRRLGSISGLSRFLGTATPKGRCRPDPDTGASPAGVCSRADSDHLRSTRVTNTESKQGSCHRLG